MESLRVLVLAETVAGAPWVFVATAAIAFRTVQSLELFAIVTNGAVDAGSYHVTVYRRFLFFIVQIAAVTHPCSWPPPFLSGTSAYTTAPPAAARRHVPL